MFLKRGAESYKATDVKWDANVAGPETTFGLKHTFVLPDAEVHDEIVGVPTTDFAEKNSYLYPTPIKPRREACDLNAYDGYCVLCTCPQWQME